ncbi:Thiol-disulfide isomerase or thioredoxin [Mycobacterium terramassiliense]|uniref:Thiol-disulfide isomerase or thioredoxin n=1 Tax=Mycobacterium terramassiliense TaxID=1841859 RepID=A0A2U3N6E1_9MYCO|nr:Thiol-disulfide isomerase or thioredoxin [Mycobacterium terramassiliense]
MPAGMLEDLISRVRSLDMNAVRAKIPARQAAVAG